MQKPSERIREEYELIKRKTDSKVEDLHKCLTAVMRYLDEEWSKNQPCKHEDSYQVDSLVGDVFYNVCNDCGVLFLANKS